MQFKENILNKSKPISKPIPIYYYTTGAVHSIDTKKFIIYMLFVSKNFVFSFFAYL